MSVYIKVIFSLHLILLHIGTTMHQKSLKSSFLNNIIEDRLTYEVLSRAVSGVVNENIKTMPLAVVLDIRTPMSSVLKYLQTGQPIVIITPTPPITSATNNSSPVVTEVPSVWHPDTVVLFVSPGPERSFLETRLLPVYQNSAFWDPCSLYIVVLPSTKDFMGVHRALTRWKIFRAIGITPNNEAVLFSTTKRPPRIPKVQPLPSKATRLPSSDFSQHTLVFVPYTHNSAIEIACLEGRFLWNDWLGEVAMTLASSMRVRALCYSEAGQAFGTRTPSGEYTGLSRSLVRHLSDLVLFTYGDDYQHWTRFDRLYPYDSEHMCVYVRLARPLPLARSVLTALSKDTWIFTCIALVSLWMMMSLIKNERSEGVMWSATEVVRAFVVGLYNKRHLTLITSLAVLTSMFGMLMTSLLRGRVTSVLAVPYSRQVNTLSELNEKIVTLYATSAITRFLKEMEDPLVRELSEKLIVKDSVMELSIVAGSVMKRHDQGVVVTDIMKPLFERSKRYLVDGVPAFHKVPECIISAIPRTIIAPAKSPYSRRLNDILQRFTEAGIINDHLVEITQVSMNRNYNLIPKVRGVRYLKPYPLKWRHLEDTFLMFAWGLLLAAAAFALELVAAAVKNFSFGRKSKSPEAWSDRREHRSAFAIIRREMKLQN